MLQVAGAKLTSDHVRCTVAAVAFADAMQYEGIQHF